jgi:hypothetical protein
MLVFHSENPRLQYSKLIREQGVTSCGIKMSNNVWVGAKVTFGRMCSRVFAWLPQVQLIKGVFR